MSAGVYRQALNSIRPNTQNSIVIGIIINSGNSKTFQTAQSRGLRGVWTFTLRDSEEDFINVTVWGSVEFIDGLTANFHIGSVAESVKTVMTIRDISEKLNYVQLPEGERVQFVTILYASVTEVNMECINETGALITRCALCKRVVTSGNDSCMNLTCPSGNGRREPMNVSNLYLKLNLKDDTGYLIGCRLTGPAAERALQCTAAEFAKMTLPERGELKWKLYLEKCDVRLQVLGPTKTFPRALYNILSIKRVRDDEADGDNEGDEEIPPFQ